MGINLILLNQRDQLGHTFQRELTAQRPLGRAGWVADKGICAYHLDLCAYHLTLCACDSGLCAYHLAYAHIAFVGHNRVTSTCREVDRDMTKPLPKERVHRVSDFNLG